MFESYRRDHFKDKQILEIEKPVKVSLASDKPTKQSAEEVVELLPKTLRPKAKMHGFEANRRKSRY